MKLQVNPRYEAKTNVNYHDNKICLYLTKSDHLTHDTQCVNIATKLLTELPILDSIGFDDVSAGGIQLSGALKSTPGYYYASVTIAYDWHDLDQRVQEFKEIFQHVENDDASSFQRFVEEGEKYGWD